VMDKNYKARDTPAISGIKISYETLLNSLVKERKKVIPLWIKIYKEKDQPIIFETSQRYRKMRDVLLRYRDNKYAPFEIRLVTL